MKKLWLLLIPAAIVALDQWLKAWTERNIALYEARELIPGVLGLTHYQNEGAAFGILSGLRWPLAAVTFLVLFFGLFAIFRGYIRHPFGLVSLSGVLGGAAGNLIDRVRQGFVVDMFEFRFINFAIFNIADIFVVCSGILFCVYWIWFHERKDGAGDGNPEAFPGTEEGGEVPELSPHTEDGGEGAGEA